MLSRRRLLPYLILPFAVIFAAPTSIIIAIFLQLLCIHFQITDRIHRLLLFVPGARSCIHPLILGAHEGVGGQGVVQLLGHVHQSALVSRVKRFGGRLS